MRTVHRILLGLARSRWRLASQRMSLLHLHDLLSLHLKWLLMQRLDLQHPLQTSTLQRTAPAEAATAPADLIAKFQGMLLEVPNDEPAMKRPSAADTTALVAEPKLKKPAADTSALVAEPKFKKAKTMLMKKPAASDKLPPGWDEQKVQRKSGASAGVWDTYYIAPWGKTYRSLAEVRAAIEEA